jgi:hypothetical protein
MGVDRFLKGGCGNIRTFASVRIGAFPVADIRVHSCPFVSSGFKSLTRRWIRDKNCVMQIARTAQRAVPTNFPARLLTRHLSISNSFHIKERAKLSIGGGTNAVQPPGWEKPVVTAAK